MAKKRSCRRTVDENRIHDKAVKMRKMTDEQLVHYVEDRVNKAHSEGYNRGIADGEKKQKVIEPKQRPGVMDFLKKIQEEGIKGIGAVTIKKLETRAREYGYE